MYYTFFTANDQRRTFRRHLRAVFQSTRISQLNWYGGIFLAISGRSAEAMKTATMKQKKKHTGQ